MRHVAERLAAIEPQRRVSLLAGVVLVAAVPLLGWMPGGQQPFVGGHHLWVTVGIAAAFAISERLVFHIESRNEAVSFSPSDLPLAVGLLLLSPPVLVATRVVGAAVGLMIWRRPPLFKFVFNLTSFTAEVVVASVILRSVVGLDATASLGLWAAMAVAIFVALALGGVLIATAISFFENDFAQRLRKELGYASLFHLPGALLGASTAVPLLVEPWLVVLVAVPAPLLWVVLRSHGALMHRFTDLRQIHEFSSQVGRSTHLQDIADTAVREIAANLRAASVALVGWDERGQTTVESSLGDDRLLERIRVRWADGLAPGAPTHHDVDGRETLVAPLSDGERVIGVVAVAERVGAVDFFSDDDVDRLGSIAPQLAVALRKGQLHVQIQHEATHDPLTGLPNRGYFEAWTSQTLAGHEGLGLLLIDLDRFKEVNDALGHHVGDLLLVEATRRIRSCLADTDIAARLGGDEFAVVSPGTGPDEASLLAERLNQLMEQPFDLGETTVAIAGSIGIVLAPDHGGDLATLMRRADLAMYDAKRRHGRASVFSPEMEGSDPVRLALLGDLRTALQDDEIQVHFQPKVDVATDRVVGAEALARWTHALHGFVAPDVFVALAEQAGLIEELTDSVLRQSVAALARWREAGAEIGVAVNLSPQSLVNEDLPERIGAVLEGAGVPAHLLTLELTEGCVMVDTPRTRRILDRLARVGIQLSVDDFGTGYSSLVNLRRLPVVEIKVDRGFVTEMLLEPDDHVIVRSTIDLAHNLGLRVVAEGVETPEVLEALGALGCDVAQGYGISRPLPADRFDAWLANRHGVALPLN